MPRRDGWNALEMANHLGNFECYNILAPLFGKELRSGGGDSRPRELALVEITEPQIVLSLKRGTAPRENRSLSMSAFTNGVSWQPLVQMLGIFLRDAELEHGNLGPTREDRTR